MQKFLLQKLRQRGVSNFAHHSIAQFPGSRDPFTITIHKKVKNQPYRFVCQATCLDYLHFPPPLKHL